MDTLEELYRRFAPLVHAKARRIVGEAEADDVVQEVFLRYLKGGPADPKALVDWLTTSAVNLSLDRLRFRARRGSAWEGELRDRAAGGAPADLEAALQRQDTCGRLLSALDLDSQQVAVLVHVEEMSQEEAASALGVSRKTIGNRLRRLEERAREVLTRWNR
ncbi:MAG: sigma-70 family RNA polymerase sigma factor [Myxococcales bacterium]